MRFVAFFIGVLFLCACQKAPQRACWKSTGPIEKSIIPINNFDFVDLHPHIELILVQDSLDYLEWEAGANLLPFLEAQIEADTLHLINKNRCKFLRYQKGKIKATLHFSKIAELHLANSDAVTNHGSWIANELLLFLKEGVGNITLDIDMQKLSIRNNYGWQHAQISGSCKALFVELDGSAAINTSQLQVVDSISFRSASALSSQIWADQLLLKAQLYGPGNLYYSGTPSKLLKSEYNSGKVLPN